MEVALQLSLEKLKGGSPWGVKGGGLAPLSANPACARPDKNLGGVYSRIRQHGDRQTTGDWQFEENFAWGEHFPQIANRPCSVCHGDMALTDAKPAFGPTEQGILLEMSDLLIDSERFGSIPTHLKNSDFRPWRTRAPELKNLVFGAPGTENPRF